MNFSAFISSPHSSSKLGNPNIYIWKPRRDDSSQLIDAIYWIAIYPVDSVIKLLNNWGVQLYLTQICIFHKQHFLKMYKDWLFVRLGRRLYTACKMKYRACRSNLRLFDNVHTPHWRQQWYVSRTAGQGPDPRDTPGNWNILFQLVLAQKFGSICSSLAV